jgi:hypothetical protein
VLNLQGCNLGNTQAAAGHEPEEGGLPRCGGGGEKPVPFVQGEEVFGMHARGEDVIISIDYDFDIFSQRLNTGSLPSLS